MSRFSLDTSIALRGFRRTPAFAITVVLILGLAIGMTTAMTSIFRSVLIQRLPVQDEERIVLPRVFDRAGVEIGMLPEQLKQYRQATRTLSNAAGVLHWGATQLPFRNGDHPLVIKRSFVTGNFFDVLGARPVLGRLLHADDEVNGTSHAVVLSYGAWQRIFGGDSSVVGRRLIDSYLGWSYPIAGVAAAGLDYPAETDSWIALSPEYTPLMTVVGRLAPGATATAAASELLAFRKGSSDVIKANMQLARSDAPTFSRVLVGDMWPTLVALTAAVALLLLIACVNVGNLMLVRAAARARELSIRRAIGASYGDVVRQLLVEAGMLAIAGGVVGALCAAALLRALVRLAPPQIPRLDEIGFEPATVVIAMVVTMASVLLFGLLPALSAARVNLAASL